MLFAMPAELSLSMMPPNTWARYQNDWRSAPSMALDFGRIAYQ
jgi:hypothetical protein